jgi:hypothetical protein
MTFRILALTTTAYLSATEIVFAKPSTHWEGNYKTPSIRCTSPIDGSDCSAMFIDTMSIRKTDKAFTIELNSTQANQHTCALEVNMSEEDNVLVYPTDQGKIVIESSSAGLSIVSTGIDPTAMGLGICGAHANINGLKFSWQDNERYEQVTHTTSSTLGTPGFTIQESGTALLFENKDHKTRYENITGDRHGLSRGITEINGAPGLFSLGRGDYYFTLTQNNADLLINCAYSDDRNTQNGARVRAGICNLDAPLNEAFGEIGQQYANQWESSVYSFDTSKLIEDNQSTDFLLSHVGTVAVYDRYPSTQALENSNPVTYVKSTQGCFYFNDDSVYLMFSQHNHGAESLDIMTSADPLTFERLNEKALTQLARERCNP